MKLCWRDEGEPGSVSASLANTHSSAASRIFETEEKGRLATMMLILVLLLPQVNLGGFSSQQVSSHSRHMHLSHTHMYRVFRFLLRSTAFRDRPRTTDQTWAPWSPRCSSPPSSLWSWRWPVFRHSPSFVGLCGREKEKEKEKSSALV